MSAVTNALRARRINGNVYVRRDDVRAYLLDTADDWDRAGGEFNRDAAKIVREIARRLAQVTA